MKDKTPRSRKVFTFEDAISALKDTEGLNERSLRGLTDLSAEQFAGFEKIWATLPDDRRVSALKTLRKTDQNSSEYNFIPLYRLALADVDERARILAIESLENDDSATLIEPFIRMLREDESQHVRAAAATALGIFVYMGELEKLPQDKHNRVYSALIGTYAAAPHNSLLQRRALESLGFANNDEISAMINDAHATDLEDMHLSALVAMGRSGDTAQFRGIVSADLKSDSSKIREKAAWACGELYLDTAVDELAKLIQDDEEDVRYAAIDALGEIATDDARAHLKRTTDSKDRELAAAAEDALAEAELMGDVVKMMDNVDDLDID